MKHIFLIENIYKYYNYLHIHVCVKLCLVISQYVKNCINPKHVKAV